MSRDSCKKSSRMIGFLNDDANHKYNSVDSNSKPSNACPHHSYISKSIHVYIVDVTYDMNVFER